MRRTDQWLLGCFAVTMAVYTAAFAAAFSDLPLNIPPWHQLLLLYFHAFPMFFLQLLLCRRARAVWRLLVPLALLAVPGVLFLSAAGWMVMGWFLLLWWCAAPLLGSALAWLVWAVSLRKSGRGANVCASLAKLATVVLLIMCAVGLAVCFTHFDPAVYASDGGLDFDFAGSASLLSLLVFSVAGWETVSKAAADASGPAARKAGAALITCLFLVTGILCLVSTAVAGCMPWREAVGRTAPFADVLVSITGVPAVRVLFLATAFVGAVGVMNSTLYSSAQMLYGLSRFALVSRAFSALHPKYGTPARCIWFTAAFVVLTPFTGRLFFLPFINIASLATIVMWIMSLAAVLRLRRARPDLRRPVRMPGGRVTAVLGVAASVFLAGNILLPFSPGALDGLEYALAAALAALGVLLYGFRDRTLSDEAREALIFGGPERR